MTAVAAAAERAGVTPGMALADARALCPALAVAPADPDGDAAALGRLALWCGRYSPWTAVDTPTADAPDGIVLDITGCAHLFGGEAAMLGDIAGRLADFGLTARLAAAPTPGAAWAVARHGVGTRAIVPDDALAETLAPLPLAALRLGTSVVEAMSRVGLKRVGDLLGKPAAPLAARFGPRLVTRLDQALGRQAETVHGLAPPPRHEARRVFAEPIVLRADVERTVAELADGLAARLADAGVGARRLDLRLYRVDGRVRETTVRTSALCREAAHMVRLFRERLDAEVEELDAGFGFDLAVLGALAVEPAIACQDGLGIADADRAGGHPDEVARLLDRFGNRFGFDRVVRYVPRESTVPERAVRAVPVLDAARPQDWPAHLRALQGGRQIGRPLLLVLPPDPVTTLAEVPDGPPMLFEWRRRTHRVARADGPERLAPEWWRPWAGTGSRTTRDYFRVEDTEGHRFWLYREGLYDRPGDSPRWFLHGVYG
ncbi:MAG: DNA polymerase Y family protein [Thalassobaculum sp.]|uniref:DUF6504 family protein n=1 Tax=Thalassobaculum sp. TaxID=2022740 RepID=UPI0032EE43D0